MKKSLVATRKNLKKIKKEYIMPDSNILELGKERFLIPEVLFNPSLANIKEMPLHEAITDVINRCDFDIRGDLYNNIILNGGSTMFRGFKEKAV
ncbi:MAG: hypothetical protein J7K59_03020 [Candidatus Korarchaeota archaeon]|nr:hypothetical protein [Candidatus Korarchaeota archaeon]